MISANEIKEVLKVYSKHGWNLSRVLLSPIGHENIDKQVRETLFGDCGIEPSDLNAAWFVRDREDGSIAWEIREFSAVPYALCESFFEDTPEVEINEQLSLMENRLRERASI